MTYSDYLRKYNCISNMLDMTDYDALEALKVLRIRDVLQSINLTNEQKKKFLDKETDSLDNFYEDFEHFLATDFITS